MEIKYLKTFQQNPRSNMSNTFGGNIPMSLEEIQQLEQLWNNGKPFPVVIREFLSIAGKHNWLFEGGNPEFIRSLILSDNKRINVPLDRPFIGLYAGLSYPQFFLVFCDEDQVDPDLYELLLYEDDEMDAWGNSDHPGQRLFKTGSKMSEYINGAVESYRDWQARGLI